MFLFGETQSHPQHFPTAVPPTIAVPEMSQELYNFSLSEVNELLGVNNGVSLSQSLSPSLQAWLCEEVNAIPGPVAKDWSSDLEEVKQTNMNIDADPFPGDYNFRIQIEDTGSKQYIYSEKLNRLYCNMDRAVPITFRWDGSRVSHVRAMLMFHDPDFLNHPVFRCRTHNDENCDNNQGCKHFRHIVRCDNENTVYKENVESRRHSVVTLLSSNQNGREGVKGLYRFMCFTTCSGVDAISRRRTNLILTLEDSNYHVVGRAVVGVKICTCPRRDKRREEEGEMGKKRRSANQNLNDTKKKREPDSMDVLVPAMVPPSPPNVPTTDNMTRQMIKTEVEGETSDYMDLQVSIPNFPTSKVGDFQSSLKRLVASYYITDDDVNAATEGVQIIEA